VNGVLGGGQIGYNWQFSPWLVLGFETDIQAADLNSQRDYIGPASVGFTAVNGSLGVDWFGTARGRVGFVMPSWPNLMIYGTGGFAYGQVVQQSSITHLFGGGAINGKSTYDTTATGWTAGGGVEWSPMSFPSWSLKVEYLYTDLGSYTQNFVGVNRFGAAPAAAVMVGANTGSARWHTVRAGVNWHFNPFASAPVLAKY
jgi:outer membrane immunogenic protein